MSVASASAIAERYTRVRDEVGSGVTVVVATKYVSADEMTALAEAGIEVVGENRAQDLERKHALYGETFRWHFIGHLQSNKVKLVNRLCELVHSVGSDSAARRLTVPALLEVNLAAEGSKSGVAPEEIGAFVAQFPLIRGLMTMPPLAADPESSRPYFGASARLRPSTVCPSSAWGRHRTIASLLTREPPSCGWERRSSQPSRARLPRLWGSATSGIARSSTSASRRTRSGMTTWKRASGSSRRATAVATARTCGGSRAPQRSKAAGSRRSRLGRRPRNGVNALRGCGACPLPGRRRCISSRRGLSTTPKQIADRFKAQIPVIINLQSADTELSKRLIDFASGLTYALDGSMQRVADKVFLLTPRDVELSAEERARAMERGGFYNQA